MVHFSRRFFILPYDQFWFARKVETRNGWGLTTMRQFLGNDPGFPFHKDVRHTLLIDLETDEEKLLSEMQKTMRYQIRKAADDGFQWEIVDDVDAFLDHYNAFAQEKKIEKVSRSTLKSQKENIVVTRLTRNGEPVVYHSYLVDPEEKRARYRYGSSARLAEDSDAALIGRGNRYCHFQDMKYFKAQGCLVYDFGGFSLGTEDPEKLGINRFKQGFGGRIVEESTFDSFWINLGKKLLGKK